MLKTVLILVVFTLSLSLKPANETQCNATFFSIIANITNAFMTQNISNLVLPYGFFEYSGHEINDLGLYKSCNSLDSTRYMLMNVYTDSQSMFFGVCVPSSCDEVSIQKLTPIINPIISTVFGSLFNKTVMQVSSVFQDPELQHPDLDGGTYVVIIIVCVLLLFCLAGTGLEIYLFIVKKKMADDEMGYKQISAQQTEVDTSKLFLFLKAFSILTNAEKIFSLKPSVDQNLDIFNGVRFLSMCWIILGHTYFVRINLSFNLDYLADLMKTPGISTIVGAASFSVDVFFCIGGFFVAFALIGKFSALKTNNFKLLGKMYFHRIYRIWPSYVLCILLYYKISIYFGSGPIWGNYNVLTKNCSENWWTNVLYIDNFFGRNTSQYCFGWGWYLSNDFQMFLVSPFVLFLYCKNKRLGLFSLMGLLSLSFLSSFLISYTNHFKADKGIVNNNDNREFFNLIYTKPWIRCDVYILGLLLGIFYLEYKKKEKFLVLKGLLNYTYIVHAFCYIFGLFLINLIIWIVAPLQSSNDINFWNDTQHIFYLIFNRVTFVIGFILMILPGLLTGNDIIHTILSFKGFTAIGRLTYCTYLVHMIIVLRSGMGTYSSFYATNESFIYAALADLVISLFAGLVLSLVAEVPLLNLEKTFILKEEQVQKPLEIN